MCRTETPSQIKLPHSHTHHPSTPSPSVASPTHSSATEGTDRCSASKPAAQNITDEHRKDKYALSYALSCTLLMLIHIKCRKYQGSLGVNMSVTPCMCDLNPTQAFHYYCQSAQPCSNHSSHQLNDSYVIYLQSYCENPLSKSWPVLTMATISAPCLSLRLRNTQSLYKCSLQKALAFFYRHFLFFYFFLKRHFIFGLQFFLENELFLFRAMILS